MPSTPNTPAPTPADDAAYYRAVLHDLIDRGADLARRVHERATAATPTPENRPDADPTIAFDRIARAVRRTIALARHVAAAPDEGAPDPPRGPARRAAARARLIRGVEDAIHRKRRETDAEALHAEFAERLDDPELDLDLAGRPVDDVIEEICRDLGIAVQARSYIWKRRTPQDIAALRARAAAPPAPPGPALHLIPGGKDGPAPDPTPDPAPGQPPGQLPGQPPG